MRRAHVPHLPVKPGTSFRLDGQQSRHLRDVLRLGVGDRIELFDGEGNIGVARLETIEPRGITVVLTEFSPATPQDFTLVVASAVPKGERADWMIEKLSEVGVTEFVPLACARSVVIPTGTGKFQRWQRIATESAKQSHRRGVMRISPLQRLSELPLPERGAFVLSTQTTSAEPLINAISRTGVSRAVTLLIGPEGGWTDEERTELDARGAVAVRLTDTVLRTETAAVVAGAIAASVLARRGC